MKVLRGDARGGMTSIDPRAGTTVAGFNNTAGRMTHTSIQ
jgi:hypothetical protein